MSEGSKIHQPTQAEFDQARSALHPVDGLKLLELANNPDTPFSIVRPFVDLEPEVLTSIHSDLKNVLHGHSSSGPWMASGVKKPEYAGITYFDGEPIVHSSGDMFAKISGFALATKLCAALRPSTAHEVNGTAERAAGSPLMRRCIYTWLGVGNPDIIDEYNSIHRLTHQLMVGQPVSRSADRMRAYFSYVVEEKTGGKRNSDVPTGSMVRRIEQRIPRRSPVRVGRARLFLHPNGESPYVRIK